MLCGSKRGVALIDFNDPYFLERKHKADELAAKGIAPFGGAYARTHSLDGVHAAFAEPFPEGAGPVVRVAGRLAATRLQGKAGFAHIAGADGRLQVYFKQDGNPANVGCGSVSNPPTCTVSSGGGARHSGPGK